MDIGFVDKAIDYAIEREEEAYNFYMDLAARMDRPEMRGVFEQFAREESGHKAKLIAIKEGKINQQTVKKAIDLKISDYLVDIEPRPDMTYQQVLVIAMKREEAAHNLYTDLASNVSDESLRNTFLMLSQEEARHKLRFETEYDEIMKEF